MTNLKQQFRFGDDSDIDSPLTDGMSGSNNIGSPTGNALSAAKSLEKKASDGFRTCLEFLEQFGMLLVRVVLNCFGY